MVKIVSLEKLVKILNSKYFNSDIVLVTGCFDLIHPAHKDFLKKAKEQGDILLVGLEIDKRVSFLKGKNRPVNNWQKRAENLAELQAVDFVFPLPEDFGQPRTRKQFFQKIKINVFALSENTPYLREKKKLMAVLGVKFFVFPFNFHYSTTKLLTK